MPLALRVLLAVLVLCAVLSFALWGTEASTEGRALSFSLFAGAAFGIVLQRSRFCFLCNFRDWHERRDPRGLLAIVAALATGLVLYQVVVSAWMPVPRPDTLPPGAHIGPVSWALVVASLVFGIGMAVSGSCLSAHLYRLGEGSPTSPFALLGALLGFGLGFLSWNSLFLATIAESPVPWLPHSLGYSLSLGLGLAALVALALLLALFGRLQPDPGPNAQTLPARLHRIFVARWPAALGGLLVGVISAASFFRVGPLGVTAELGSIARTAGASLGALPDTLHGLDALRGCMTVVKETLLSRNGAFVLALVAGAWSTALVANQFRPAWPTLSQVFRGLLGGILMGWGAMIGLGCTVGVLLSGIHAGAVSGWVFLVFCTAGVWGTLAIQKRLAGA